MVPLIILTLYLAGMLVTARHLVYQIKLRNDGRRWYEKTLEPRLYRRSDYQSLDGLNGTRFFLASDYPSDYQEIFRWSMFFPVYWVGVLGRTVIIDTVKKTPGEVEAERQRAQQELNRLQREVDRLKKEQDGPR